MKHKHLQGPASCGSGDWMLQKADAIKGFLAQQRGRSQHSNSKAAWLVAWELLAAEGELAAKQLQQVLQPGSCGSCAELAGDVAELAELQQQLSEQTQEELLQLLGQVQELSVLTRRAVAIGTPDGDLQPAEAAALISLQQELQWLLQDTRQQQQLLAASAQELVTELTAAAPGSCGASAGMLDVLLLHADRNGSSECVNECVVRADDTDAATAAEQGPSARTSSSSNSLSTGATSAPVASKAHPPPAAAATAAAAVAAAVAAVEQQALAAAGPAAAATCMPPADMCYQDTQASRSTQEVPASATTPSRCCADPELQQLLLQHCLAPASVCQQLLEAYSQLLLQHQQQVQEVYKQQQAHARSCTGWAAHEHALFVWLRTQALQKLTTTTAAGCQPLVKTPATTARQYSSRDSGSRNSSSKSSSSSSSSISSSSSSRSGPQGCSRSAVLDYLAVHMPGKTRQQLQAHEAWYTTAVQLQRRAADLQDSWCRQKGAFLQAADAGLAAAAAATAAAAQAAASRLSTAVSRQLLHDQRESMQAVRQQQQEAEAAEAAAVAAVAAARAAAEAAARQERCDGQKLQVLQYKQEVLQQQWELEAVAAAAAAHAAAEAAAAVEASRPAVAARQEEALQRLQQQQEQQRARDAAAEARQQRLAAIAAALGPKGVERDPVRLLQQTAASAAAAPLIGQAFKPVHGFTAQQVTADPRFRLVEALRAAGALSGGASSVKYLKQALARLRPLGAQTE